MVENEAYQLRLPHDAREQLCNLQEEETRERITFAVYRGLIFYLRFGGVDIDLPKSGYRAKTKERIIEKMNRRGDLPILDIYGIRLVTDYSDRKELGRIIQAAYPQTPGVFMGDRFSLRDYADESVKERHRAQINPEMSQDYSAFHLNVVFQSEKSEGLEIAEIQIMSSEEYDLSEKNRKDYIEAQKRRLSSQTSANSCLAR